MNNKIEIFRNKNIHYSLGLALDLLRRSDLYYKMEAGKLVGMLMGQMKREHYCFLLQNGNVMGYCGWALCEESIARKWINKEYIPSYSECMNGNVLVIVTLSTSKSKGLYYLKSVFKELYPAHLIYGMRNYISHNRPVMSKL